VLFDAVFSYFGKCWSFIADSVVIYDFDWKKSSAYSAIAAAIMWADRRLFVLSRRELR